MEKEELELTILIPALNEEKTIELVIQKAWSFIQNHEIKAEVLVANNGSTDHTKEIAEKNKARVIDVPERGYGNALREGIKQAKGKYVIFGDADDSYDLSQLEDFLTELRAGSELVIGNRYGKTMEKGAMSFSHRYFGTPLLSFLIRHKYHINVYDINSGLRGMKRESILNLNCQATGMEFASEMLIKANDSQLKITEIPIFFYCDKREGKSHLRTITDGVRHLVQIGKNENKRPKGVMTYLITFLIIVVLGVLALLTCVYLPDQKVKENCQQAAKKFSETTALFPELEIGRTYTTVDHYADSILLSIIYSLDKTDPLASIMRANYYEDNHRSMTANFLALTEEKAEANTQYVRYWHGSIVWIKPLLMFFSLEQVYQISGVVLWGLLILLLIVLAKIEWKAVIGFIIAIFMTAFFVVPQCLEYTAVFVVAFLVSLIALSKDKGKNSPLYYLFFITGALTCYFDFLTVEMLTILLPLTLVIIKRNKENTLGTSKEVLKFLVISLTLWLIAYAGMYLVKWILASIVLNKNYILESIHNADIRISGQVNHLEKAEMWIQAVKRNFDLLNPFFFIRKKYLLYIWIPIIWLISIVINLYQGKKRSYLLAVNLLAVLPYMRYVVLQNHSCYHFIFTFRLQLVTIVIFVLQVVQMVQVRKKRVKNGSSLVE